MAKTKRIIDVKFAMYSISDGPSFFLGSKYYSALDLKQEFFYLGLNIFQVIPIKL